VRTKLPSIVLLAVLGGASGATPNPDQRLELPRRLENVSQLAQANFEWVKFPFVTERKGFLFVSELRPSAIPRYGVYVYRKDEEGYALLGYFKAGITELRIKVNGDCAEFRNAKRRLIGSMCYSKDIGEPITRMTSASFVVE